jgi:antitoxin VapB
LIDTKIIYTFIKAFYQGGLLMPVTAKIFMSGRSQAVRLPKEFRFEGKEVFIRRDAISGDIILSHHPDSWSGLFELDTTTEVPADFMHTDDRTQPEQLRDPFEGWTE